MNKSPTNPTDAAKLSDSETTEIAIAVPRRAYESRLEAHTATATKEAATCEHFSSARALVFFGGIIVVLILNSSLPKTGTLSYIPLVVLGGLVAGFVGLVWQHGRHQSLQVAADRLAAHYQRNLDRLADKWHGIGSTGDEYDNPQHLYASDLDIFGKGSLFQYLSVARTTLGESTLAAWLSAPATPEEIRARQAAIQELKADLTMREDLARIGADLHDALDPRVLRDWSEGSTALPATSTRTLAYGLGGFGAIALAVTLYTVLAPPPQLPGYVLLVLAYCANLVFLHRIGQAMSAVTDPLLSLTRHVERLSAVLKVFESHEFTSPRLNTLSAQIRVEGLPPSQQFARLERLIDSFLSAKNNALIMPFTLLFLQPVQIAYRIESWRREVGESIPKWLTAVGEFEALVSLANYSYENPDYVVPTIVTDAPRIEATALGHPLLPRAECVKNDLSLNPETRLILISGSNMSGKSTLLRSVGTSIVLALAGAPVRAATFTVSPLAVGASIQIHDSLSEGQSHFYAEIARLRAVVGLLDGDLPLLFLLDEILHGTNSHDRTAGASRVLVQIIERGAMGLVTTHDLALAKVVDEVDGKGKNMHFQDDLIDGRMVFDYRFRPGVVEKSNALALMRAVGLEV